MKQVFAVVGEIRNWIKGHFTDPKSRLYSTTILVAMGIITCNQMQIPVTMNSLMRVTGFSSMQIYRGTETLTKHGFLDRDTNGVWSWLVEIPPDIENLHPVASSNSNSVEELKAFITESLENIQLKTPNGQAKIGRVVESIKKFEPAKKPRPQSGPAALFGDAVLDVDDD